jgi:peptidoglycan/LPS O-acetylase OafA/YrhL
MQELITLLARRNTNGQLIKEVDGLRCVAVLAVLCSHFNLYLTKASGLDETFLFSHPLSRFLELCGYGVSIFFCISGFILVIPFAKHYLLAAEKPSLKKYYVRRLTRLEPPYLLVLTLLLLCTVLLLHQPWLEALPHYIASFFYSHNIIYGRRSTINPVAWTLEIEIQFYLLLPIFAKLFAIKKLLVRRLVLIALIVSTGVFYIWLDAQYPQSSIGISIIAYLPIFFIGFLLADVYLQHHHQKLNASFVWDAAAIAGFTLIIYCNGAAIFYIQWLEYIGYFLLFAGAFKGLVVNKVLTNTWVMIVGCMCYSIYLIHYAIIYFTITHITMPLLSHSYYKNLIVQGIIVLPLVMVLATFFYVFVEKTCMDKDWAKKLWQKFKPH